MNVWSKIFILPFWIFFQIHFLFLIFCLQVSFTDQKSPYQCFSFAKTSIFLILPIPILTIYYFHHLISGRLISFFINLVHFILNLRHFFYLYKFMTIVLIKYASYTYGNCTKFTKIFYWFIIMSWTIYIVFRVKSCCTRSIKSTICNKW
jgi:hypothetical protein